MRKPGTSASKTPSSASTGTTSQLQNATAGISQPRLKSGVMREPGHSASQIVPKETASQLQNAKAVTFHSQPNHTHNSQNPSSAAARTSQQNATAGPSQPQLKPSASSAFKGAASQPQDATALTSHSQVKPDRMIPSGPIEPPGAAGVSGPNLEHSNELVDEDPDPFSLPGFCVLNSQGPPNGLSCDFLLHHRATSLTSGYLAIIARQPGFCVHNSQGPPSGLSCDSLLHRATSPTFGCLAIIARQSGYAFSIPQGSECELRRLLATSSHCTAPLRRYPGTGPPM
ncbi:hypothetical protein B0H17DRAFT_1203869 [Mycena rosella]|uniref:Uncharacterized protein n=1 Tax=Mycena rosella TaxID=1033263 RepID=A0AAD7DC83_MYCRO|nr:hypothetical protein B0H17DRAFT_1203869 [Mycena rosella]